MLGWVEGSNTCRRPYRTAGPSNDLASGLSASAEHRYHQRQLGNIVGVTSRTQMEAIMRQRFQVRCWRSLLRPALSFRDRSIGRWRRLRHPRYGVSPGVDYTMGRTGPAGHLDRRN